MDRARRSTTSKLAASLAILAAVGAFVSFGVFSEFATTQSNASSLSSATFGLTQSPTTSNLLDTILSLVPGDTITRCVQLTNTGSTPMTVTANPSMSNTTGTLNSVATMTIDEVSGVDTSTAGAIKSCTPSGGSVSVVGSVLSSTVGSGLSSLHPALAGNGAAGRWNADESHVYRIVIGLPASITDFATYGGNQVSTGVDFTATQVAGAAK